MPNYNDIEIIDSVGIEMEISCINRESPAFKRKIEQNLHGYKRVHDASCETRVDIFADTNLPITFENKEDRIKLDSLFQKTIIGGEIISPIRNSSAPSWVEEVKKLCEILHEFGETEESERDSFHVHVNVSQQAPLFMLRNLLILTGNLEAILFRLGGMGRKNRGEENHFCYQRPFLGKGPPIISMHRGNFPILVYDDLMKAETRQDFFNMYGNSRYWANAGKRYVTHRYMCLNFHPILTQGSFEFRTANKTLTPEYVLAWTNFCKAFVQKAYSTRDEASFEEIKRPLHENRDISTNEFLAALSYLDELDEDSKEVLADIWEMTPVPQFDNLWRYSHLPEPTLWIKDSTYIPSPIKGDIQKAEYIDIHVLDRQNRHENNPRPDPVIRRVEQQNNHRFRMFIGDEGFDARELPCFIFADGVTYTWDNTAQNIIAEVMKNEGIIKIDLYDYLHTEEYEDAELSTVWVAIDIGSINLDFIMHQLRDGIHPDDIVGN